MARSEITRGGKELRPSFNQYDRGVGQAYTPEEITSQMAESIRNVLEGIADSQILRCEVARDICRTREAVETLVRMASRKRRKITPVRGKRT